ncbi:TRAP transporter small permease [Janibacter corallicola]|uniref:TRAP transporter small permease n=1 Tax=Janibacter corallicola TaxID=415212 RepID=UPI00083647C0|nr:TRAP transporter small permease [Janibacter corallicola]
MAHERPPEEEHGPRDGLLGVIERTLLGLSIIVMSVLVVGNVISRNLFGVSWAFTEEIGSLLLIVVTFGGLGYAAHQRRHIAMSALYDLLADRGRDTLGWLVSVVSAATMLVMAYLGARYAIQIYASGDSSNVLGIPMFLPLSVIPVGFLLAAMRFVADLWPLPGHGRPSEADVETSWEG